MLLPGGKTWLLCCGVLRILKHRHPTVYPGRIKGLERPRVGWKGFSAPASRIFMTVVRAGNSSITKLFWKDS